MFKWLRERRNRTKQYRFDRGFGSVMVAYFLYKHPIDFIEQSIPWSDYADDFDDGARAALSLLPEDDE